MSNQINAQLLAALKMVLDDPSALDGRPRTYECVMAAIAAAEAVKQEELTIQDLQAISDSIVIDEDCFNKINMKLNEIDAKIFEEERFQSSASNVETFYGSNNPPASEPVARLSWDDYNRARVCVNACEGLSTENLENNLPLVELVLMYNSTIKQRDQLLAALEGIKELMGYEWLRPEFEQADAAIKAAKGE